MESAVFIGIVLGTITLAHMITLIFLLLATCKIRQLQAEIGRLRIQWIRLSQSRH